MSVDLTSLFLPAKVGSTAQSVMAGTCTAWDLATGHSTIVVGTVAYTNLPILNAALATMGTGAVVLLTTPASYLVLGRLTVPT